MENKQLPYADKTLIFGVASAVFFCAGCVLAALILFTDGILANSRCAAISVACAVAAMICGATAVDTGNKAVGIYNENPSPETPGYGKLKTGRICACVAVIASALFIMAATLTVCIFGIEKLDI